MKIILDDWSNAQLISIPEREAKKKKRKEKKSGNKIFNQVLQEEI